MAQDDEMMMIEMYWNYFTIEMHWKLFYYYKCIKSFYDWYALKIILQEKYTENDFTVLKHCKWFSFKNDLPIIVFLSVYETDDITNSIY